jgi:hypothetical protein
MIPPYSDYKLKVKNGVTRALFGDGSPQPMIKNKKLQFLTILISNRPPDIKKRPACTGAHRRY